MFGWGESHDAYNEVQSGEHEGSFSHELIAGAAAFEGFKAFEDHQRSEGKQVSHGTAKEILAGLAAAEADKLAETKGLDMMDREKAKHRAKEGAKQMYDEHYGDQDQYDPSYGAPDRLQQQYGSDRW